MTITELSEEQKKQAQTALINTSLQVGSALLFDHIARSGWQVEASGCRNAEMLVAMLSAIPDDGERIAKFDTIARDNGFALFFKSEGIKSNESIAAKLKRKGPKAKEADLTDLIRLSAFSEDLELLDTYSERLRQATTTTRHSSTIEGWHLKQSGALLNVLKCQIDGVNGEVQFIPQQQARLATRITHHFYKIVQDYDTLANSDEPDPGEVRALVKRYTNVARCMNRLASNDTLNQPAMRDCMNALLSSQDFDYLAFDEKNEGVNPTNKVRYSDIFSTNYDIQRYRSFFRELGPALTLFPMDELDPNTPLEKLDIPMIKLLNCAQITYAGYIQDAPENLRNLWVSLAQRLNEQSPSSDKAIPTALIDAVPNSIVKTGGKNGHAL